MTVQPVQTSYQTPTPLRAPAPMNPLYREIQTYETHALDGTCGYSKAVTLWGKRCVADSKHDRCLAQARLCFSRGEYAMADYWVEQAQCWNERDGSYTEAIWTLFSKTADSCRQIVMRVERLLTRSTRSKGGAK